jgi:serine/threonine-protein kinase
MVASRDKFSAYQSGAYRPSSSGERLDLVEWCAFKKLYATAVGLYSDAFAADPKLAEQLQFGHRYNAACSASLAASGQSEDAVKLDTRELTQLRKQALDWLRADLALQEKQLANGKLTERNDVIKRLGHWRKDTDLAGIRDAQALAKLPSEEQHAFAQLWADVAALLKKAEETDRTGSPVQAKTIDKTLELAPLPRKKK